MSHDQAVVLAVWAGTLALLAWGRWRFDLVGLLALVAAVLLGAVPAEGAFAGFSDPAVPAIAGVLVLSAALRDSGLLDAPRRALVLLPRWTGLEVGVLGGITAALSAVMNNFDAYAAMLPAARATVRRSRRSPAPIVAALGAASLLGGLVTAVGTPPNLLVASLRRDLVGAPFRVLDFAPVGATVAVAGVLALAALWRLLPSEQRGEREEGTALASDSYTSEVAVPAGSSLVGQTVAALRARTERTVSVAAIIREDYRRTVPRVDTEIEAGDVLVLDCEPDALQALMERAGSAIVGGAAGLDPDRIGVVEAVVTPTSELVGVSPAEAGLDERHRVGLLAIGRRGGAIAARLRRTKLRAGDVLVLQGEIDAMGPTLSALGCLTLAERRLRLGRHRRVGLPALLLVGALALAAAGLLPLAVALLCAVAALVALRIATMTEVYNSVAWPMVVLFGTLLPLSAALRRSGAADLIAGHLAAAAADLPAGSTVAVALVAALAASPLVNGAAAVLVLGPLAASFAARVGASADPYLMAVAVGASCDFLSPIGARSNILALGGERRAARPSPRLGLALALVVAVVGSAAILVFWPAR